MSYVFWWVPTFVHQITTKKKYSHLAVGWNKSQITVCRVKIRTPPITLLFTKILIGFLYWENRSNTLVSEKWHADITPSRINLPASHIVFKLFLYHTFYDFLCRVYTRSVLLGSCITLPDFLLVLYHTTLFFAGVLSHQLFN